MYPVLVVAGGLVTVTYDYRFTIVKFSKSRLRQTTATASSISNHHPPVETQSAPFNGIDLLPRPVAPLPPDIVTDPTREEAVGVTPRTAGTGEENSLRRRYSGIAAPNQHASVSQQLATTPIMTPTPILACVVGIGVIVEVMTLLVLRSQLASPPRALDFLANMTLAGIIIFGVSMPTLNIDADHHAGRSGGESSAMLSADIFRSSPSFAATRWTMVGLGRGNG